MGSKNVDEHVSIDVETMNRNLAKSIKGKLCENSPFLSENCIFKVPGTLRMSNEKFFQPKIVSIGPYHRENDRLKPMEKMKLWYLQCLLERFPLLTPEHLVESVRKEAGAASKYYAEKLNGNEKFIETLVVDGCFLIELFRRDAYLVPHKEDDPVFNTAWMLENLYHDLILLENQIPWFILQLLFDLTIVRVSEREEGERSLPNLVLKFFEARMLMAQPAEDWSSGREIKHILDLLHNSLSFGAKEPKSTKWELFPPVTDLLQAGIKFKKGNANNILNITFENGVLEIPPIKIQGNSESLFRNLIAYEQCRRQCGDILTSYAVFFDCLINTSKDADLLCEKNVIAHALSTEDLSIMFNRLYNDTLVGEFYYGEEAEKVNKYYRSKWSRARASLSRDYFNNPWSYFSFAAAILILIFTFTQTLFSILEK